MSPKVYKAPLENSYVFGDFQMSGKISSYVGIQRWGETEFSVLYQNEIESSDAVKNFDELRRLAMLDPSVIKDIRDNLLENRVLRVEGGTVPRDVSFILNTSAALELFKERKAYLNDTPCIACKLFCLTMLDLIDNDIEHDRFMEQFEELRALKRNIAN
jgi:hypothetical protein